MPDSKELRKALEHTPDSWDKAWVERALAGLEPKRRRRAVRRGAAGAGLVAAAAIGAVLLWPLLADQNPTDGAGEGAETGVAASTAPAPATQETTPEGVLRFVDGSTAAPLDEETRLVATEVTADRVVVAVEQGGGRFDVDRRPEREFRVVAGDVSVAVRGTTFLVERQGARVRVAVEEGRVHVEWPDGSRDLDAGQEGLFPPAEEPGSDRAEPVAATAAPTTPRTTSGAGRQDWRALAEQGEFERAYEAMSEGRQPVRDAVDDLLLAADAARLSGHPAAALPYLDRVVQQHRGDPRAALAAFTRGRVLLHQLGRPRDAAGAFADTQRLAPSGSLAEDALAREVEAWHRAGATVEARRRALRYIERYPEGTRLRLVRRYGGME